MTGLAPHSGGEPVHAFILTLDEDKHIARCIASIRAHCASVLVIDSGSSDRTCEIARELGAEVIVHPFTPTPRRSTPRLATSKAGAAG